VGFGGGTPPIINMTKFILSLDIGAINMAYVFCQLSPIEVDDMDGMTYVPTPLATDRLSIVNCIHNHVSAAECTLHHSSNWCDRVAHFVAELRHILPHSPDIVLIEKQPPLGFVQIEQLLVSTFRDKMVLVNPITVHTWLGLKHGQSTREWRKEVAIKTGGHYLAQFSQYSNDDRKHDMADAMTMILFYIDRHLKTTKPRKMAGPRRDINSFFGQFARNSPVLTTHAFAVNASSRIERTYGTRAE